MRYQGRSYKSRSLLGKQNKQNADTFNLHPNLKKDVHYPSKLDKKISESTGITIIKPIQNIQAVYSKQIAEDYSNSIFNHINTRIQPLNGYLNNHNVTPALRSKMVDWMIEVLSSYKMTEETFFRSVHFMDLFFKKCQVKQELKDLHLIGVTSMFIASKYQQIHPFKMGLIHDKISRKKFSQQEILNKQSEIINQLDFLLEHVNLYDFVKHALYELDFELDVSALKYFKQIALYLSKMCIFSSQLVEENMILLCGAVIFISLKTLQQSDKKIQPEKKIAIITHYLKIEQSLLIECSRKVLNLAKNFSKLYPNLANLKKFNKFEYHSE